MRGSGMRRSSMCVAAGLALAAALDCASTPRCTGVSCAAACPRDADRDPSGRCVCAAGDALVLGACVAPAVGDAFCGPGARVTAGGCVFRSCPVEEALDVATGECTARAVLVHGGEVACPGGWGPSVENGRGVCIAHDAACPRGTTSSGPRTGALDDAGGGDGVARCQAPVRCPAGTLVEGGTCRPIVTVSGRAGEARVDLGAWTALVLGVDGGPGSPLLCRPLAQRPALFGLVAPASMVVSVRVALRAADEDISRISAEVHTSLGAGVPAPVAEAWVRRAVETALEPLRGLGGQSSTAAVEVEVRCPLGV